MMDRTPDGRGGGRWTEKDLGGESEGGGTRGEGVNDSTRAK